MGQPFWNAPWQHIAFDPAEPLIETHSNRKITITVKDLYTKNALQHYKTKLGKSYLSTSQNKVENLTLP